MNKPSLGELPRVDRLVAHPALRALGVEVGSALLTELVRASVGVARQSMLSGERNDAPSEDEVADQVLRRAASLDASRSRWVINATGVLLHTNVGRAPLSSAARQALIDSTRGYLSLEMDLETGKRGGRAAFAESALRTLSGADAALVVNNCAAAVLLALASIARGKGVIVSRGELVEIGGSFRVPEILAASGARLIEIGTTNRTHLPDYLRAIRENPECAAILRVHQGNFRMSGFVERPALRDLAELAHAEAIPLIEDLGGGALVEVSALASDRSSSGFSGEPTVQASVRAGVDVVCFSGDKVLGGPQAGILVGKRDVIDGARKHPLARALRLGRLPLVALEATLSSYLRGAVSEIPALASVAMPLADVEARALRWKETLSQRAVDARVTASEVEMGGGSLADRQIPSFAVAIRSPMGADAFAARLRQGKPAVLGRVLDDALLLDARSVLPGEDEVLMEAVLSASV